jgi:hypothetical protein
MATAPIGWRTRLGRLLAERDPARWILFLLLAFNLIALARGVFAHALHSFARIVEPSAILWLEPIFLRSALRASENLPLYVAPTSEYVSGMYTPLVDLVHGWILGVFGVSYPPLRVFAFVVFVGLLALFFRWVQRETRSALFAAICVGLVLTMSHQVRYWFSSVNVDAAYLLAGFGGAYVLRFSAGTRGGAALAGALMALSFLCKPQGFVLSAMGFAYLIAVERRHLLWYAGTCALLAGAPSLYYLVASDGWYWTSMVTVPFEYPSKATPRLLRSLAATSWLGAFSLFAALPVLATLIRDPEKRRPALLLLLLGVGSLLISVPSFNKAGGDFNSLYPALLVGMLCFAVVPSLVSRPGNNLPMRLAQLAVAALLLQIGFQRSENVTETLLAAESIDAGRARVFAPQRAFELRVSSALAEAEVPFVGARPRLQHALGKPLNTHQTPLYNLTVRTRLKTIPEIFGDRIERQAFDRILLWEYPDSPLTAEVQKHYRRAGDIGDDPLLSQLRVAWWRPKRNLPPSNLPQEPPPTPGP